MRKLFEWICTITIVALFIKPQWKEFRKELAIALGRSDPASTVQRSETAPTAQPNSAVKNEAQKLKEMRPKLVKLAEAVEAYTLALETTVSSASLLLSEVNAFANSPEMRRAFAANPVATQKTINETCSKAYDAFNRGAKKNMQILEENSASSKFYAAQSYIDIYLSEGGPKEVLARITGNCKKANVRLGSLASAKFDVAERMQQVKEAGEECAPLAQELRQELDLLRALIQSTEKL